MEKKTTTDLITTDVTEIQSNLENSQEIKELASQLDINNEMSVSTFGQGTAEEISKYSDKVLHRLEQDRFEDTNQLMISLTEIMDTFDDQDFTEEEKKGLISKLFGKAKKSVEDLLKKYNTMGKEIDKITIELKRYERSILQSNSELEEMYIQTIGYYKELEKYIQAGHYAIEHMQTDIIPQLEETLIADENPINEINLNRARTALEQLEARVYDLELSKAVAIQTLPQIELIKKGNSNLQRKINSAFIITLPIFKNGLIQALTIKKQQAQAKALKSLDDKTNELLIKNSKNLASASKLTAELSSGSAIKPETLQETWSNIKQAIVETKEIEERAKQERSLGKEKIKELQAEYKAKSTTGLLENKKDEE